MNFRDADGKTALHWAAHHRQVEVIRLLAGCHDIDMGPVDRFGFRPIHYAAVPQAGLSREAADVPEPIEVEALLLVAHWALLLAALDSPA